MEANIDGETRWITMTEAPAVLGLLLLERNLISRDLLPTRRARGPGRAMAFGESETVSVMVNEEDHLRSRPAAGLDLDLAWERAEAWILPRGSGALRDLGAAGTLTGCPAGAPDSASVMLHLPALGMVRQELDKVYELQRTGLAVRGCAGEGRFAGDLYQISNQVTLGRSEADLIDDLRALVPEIVRFERRMREALQMRQALVDRIALSFGTLRTSRAMPTEAALKHLSSVRLGLHTGIFRGAKIALTNWRCTCSRAYPCSPPRVGNLPILPSGTSCARATCASASPA